MTGKYEANWDSLLTHRVPEWALDAKFGIYAHWGIYSVASFGTEWYAKRMYDVGSSCHEHFVSTYGDLSQVGYKDLVPKFTAEHYDPEQWADLYAESGARFGGFSLVHHDGYLLWDSAINRWNAMQMGPKRDLYGEFVTALRRRGLKISATFHHLRSFNWYLPGTGGLGEFEETEACRAAREAGWDIFDPAYADLYWNQYTGKFEDFIAEWQAKVLEVVAKYEPDLMWFDGGYFREENTRRATCSMFAEYFNRAAAQGKEVAILNKLPVNLKFNFPRDFGILTFEQGRDREQGIERPWIDDINIARSSWSYVEGQQYKSPRTILHALVDSVSRGGGLFLSLAPMPDGTIPEAQVTVLREIGKWLKVNGEAIFDTRPWTLHAEGDFHKMRPGRGAWNFDECDASDIRFTQRGNVLYATALGWPEGGRLTIETLKSNVYLGSGGITSVQLLGCDGGLNWTRDGQGLHIDLPPKPHDYAYAFKIELDGVLD